MLHTSDNVLAVHTSLSETYTSLISKHYLLTEVESYSIFFYQFLSPIFLNGFLNDSGDFWEVIGMTNKLIVYE